MIFGAVGKKCTRFLKELFRLYGKEGVCSVKGGGGAYRLMQVCFSGKGDSGRIIGCQGDRLEKKRGGANLGLRSTGK